MRLTRFGIPTAHSSSSQTSEPPPPNKACKSNMYKKTRAYLQQTCELATKSVSLKLRISFALTEALKEFLQTNLSPRIRDNSTKEEQEHCEDKTFPSWLSSARAWSDTPAEIKMRAACTSYPASNSYSCPSSSNRSYPLHPKNLLESHRANNATTYVDIYVYQSFFLSIYPTTQCLHRHQINIYIYRNIHWR